MAGRLTTVHRARYVCAISLYFLVHLCVLFVCSFVVLSFPIYL
jgi:hypothetical protein